MMRKFVVALPFALAIACAAKPPPPSPAPPVRPVASESTNATDAGFALYDDAGLVPAPEQTCDKLQELADKDAAERETGKPFKLSREKCLKNLYEMAARDPKAYVCSARVIAKLTNLDTAFAAISLCDRNRPGTENTEDE
jgi:hypothetical protein